MEGQCDSEMLLSVVDDWVTAVLRSWTTEYWDAALHMWPFIGYYEVRDIVAALASPLDATTALIDHLFGDAACLQALLDLRVRSPHLPFKDIRLQLAWTLSPFLLERAATPRHVQRD